MSGVKRSLANMFLCTWGDCSRNELWNIPVPPPIDQGLLRADPYARDPGVLPLLSLRPNTVKRPWQDYQLVVWSYRRLAVAEYLCHAQTPLVFPRIFLGAEGRHVGFKRVVGDVNWDT